MNLIYSVISPDTDLTSPVVGSNLLDSLVLYVPGYGSSSKFPNVEQCSLFRHPNR